MKMTFTEKEVEYIIDRVEKAFLGCKEGFERDATEGGTRALLHFCTREDVDFYVIEDVVSEMKRNNDFYKKRRELHGV